MKHEMHWKPTAYRKDNAGEMQARKLNVVCHRLPRTTRRIIDESVKHYIQTLKDNRIAVWRLYLFGSYAKGKAQTDSDIDLAIFWDRDEIDGFDEDVLLMRLTRDVDLRIEPHSFSRNDFDNPDPFVRDIITTGERIL